MSWPNGSSAGGDWNNDKMNGNVHIILASGGDYEGKVSRIRMKTSIYSHICRTTSVIFYNNFFSHKMD